MTWVLLALLGCGGEALPPVLQRGMPQCRHYAPGTESYTYCHRHHAHEIASLEEAEKYCPEAGEWEEDCRLNWVIVNSSPGTSYSNLELHTFCAGNPDCNLQVLDSRPAEVAEQLVLCHRWGGKYSEDCAIHALQRWIHSSPSDQEFQTLRTSQIFVHQSANFTAMSVQCFGQGTCGDGGQFTQICEQKVEYFRTNPRRCPRKRQEGGPDPVTPPGMRGGGGGGHLPKMQPSEKAPRRQGDGNYPPPVGIKR